MPALSLFSRRQRQEVILSFASLSWVCPHVTKCFSCTKYSKSPFHGRFSVNSLLSLTLKGMNCHPHFYRWINWVSQRSPQDHLGQDLNFLHVDQAVKWQSSKESIFKIKNTVGGGENVSFNTRKGIKNNPVYTRLITLRSSITVDTVSTIFPSIIPQCLSKASQSSGRSPLRYT